MLKEIIRGYEVYTHVVKATGINPLKFIEEAQEIRGRRNCNQFHR
jgi:hypothetical protein